MQSRVIVRRSINVPPEGEVNKGIEELGEGWRVISAQTTTEIFGLKPEVKMDQFSLVPLHHCLYTTTVVVQKD